MLARRMTSCKNIRVTDHIDRAAASAAELHMTLVSTAAIPKTAPQVRYVKAALLMLGCCALMSVVTLLGKALGQGIWGPPMHPIQVTAARYGVCFAVFALACIITRTDFTGAPWGAHAIRASVGMMGFLCLFTAVAQMPLTEATAISLLAPFVTLLLAIPLLGERVGPWRWAAAAVSFIGALFIIRPGTEAFQPAALIALGAALFSGLEATLIKRLSRGEPVLRILVLNNGFGAVISALMATTIWIAPSPAQWAMMLALGLCMATAGVMFTMAFKMADASSLMPLIYFTLVFTAIYDVALFASYPDALAIGGAGAIGVATIILAWRERALHRRPAPLTVAAHG
jgi:drug/metabolite transporter (DMT)-like permease